MAEPNAVAAGAPSPGAPALFDYLQRLGDDRLVLGHRLSEWCGHGPILEEDIALGNVALDLLGQAAAILRLAGQVEGKGRDEDALAYFREAVEFRNALLVELPRGDFAATIVRQFLFDAYDLHLTDALSRSAYGELAAIAAKAHKEARYHVRHSGEWVVRLGDGTDESHRRAQDALDALWRFTPELLTPDAVDAELAAAGIAADLLTVRARWDATVREVIDESRLRLPPATVPAKGGREGRHTEHLGHLLAELQIVARSFPGATW